MRKFRYTFFILILSFVTAYSQNANISLLQKQLKKADKEERVLILEKLAEAYLEKDNAKAALYADEGRKLIRRKRLEVKPETEAGLYNTLASAYYYEGDFRKSLRFFEKEFEITSKFSDKDRMIKNYFNLGILSQRVNKKRKAAGYFEDGYKLAKEMKSVDLQLHFLKASYLLYDEWGKSDLALQNLSEYTALKDRQFRESKNTVGILREKYQKEKVLREYTLEELQESEQSRNELAKDTSIKGRQLDILRLEKAYAEKINKQQKALSKADSELDMLRQERQRSRTIFLAFTAALILGAALWLLLLYRQKRRAHNQLEIQADLLEEANVLLSEKNEQITDSINYARRIQDSIMVPESEIRKHLPNAFIFYQPKDIVSGDFYWFSKLGNEFVLAAIDCTGHGVPGAFMSMIGYTLLNEIVNEKRITKPDHVLKHLHLGVMAALQKAGSDSSADDGMDMSLCTINPKQKRFRFAGAKNHLYVMQADKLKVLKANHHTVGGRPLRDDITVEFTSYDFMYDHNTSIYMMSDGYMDQFGGLKDTKFNAKRFKKLLIDNRHLPMQEQKAIIDKTLKDWKGEREQVDDILVVGVKLD